MHKNFLPQTLLVLILFYILVGCQQPHVYPSETQSPQITLTPPHLPPQPAQSYLAPQIGQSFQIQLSDYPPDLDLGVDIIEIDLFETTSSAIEFLHDKDTLVICYFNAGAWEAFRPDADSFPESVIGKKYAGWPGEHWLDIANYELFSHVMRTRLDLALEKGCDGVDPDNINGYQQDSGFDISAQDQLLYNLWLSQQAHLRDLSIGLKNDNTQVPFLVDYFDFAVIEDCAVFNECGDYGLFIEKGKPVFQIEYTDRTENSMDFCGESLALGYTAILKNRTLDAFFALCD